MLVQAVSAVVTTHRAKKYQARLMGAPSDRPVSVARSCERRPQRRVNPVQRAGRMENDQDGAGSVDTEVSATGPGVNLSDDHEASHTTSAASWRRSVRGLGQESDAGDRRQALDQQLPMLARVDRPEDLAVRGAEDDDRAGRGQARRVDVVVEPLRKAVGAALEARPALEPLAVDRRASAVESRGRRDQHVLAGDGDRAHVVSVQAGACELPCIAAILADAEAFRSGDQDHLGARRVSEHLVDVRLDVHGRRPGRPAIARACDATDVDVHVNRSVGRDRDRSHVGRITPGRVPRLAAGDRFERVHTREPAVGQPEEVRLLGADQRPGHRRCDARRGRPIDRGMLLPGSVAGHPQRRAIHDRPRRRAIEGERGHAPAGERLHRARRFVGELPEPAASPDENFLSHARMILSGRLRVMKTDLLLIPMSAQWADMRAAALAAEDAGFDGLWTWDHLRDPDVDAGGPGVPEAWTVLTALAEVTRRVALGPLVLNVANRHPGVLANMAAPLQAVTGGGLLLARGAGGNRGTPYAAEQSAIGQSVERDKVRADRVVEAIGLIRRLWSGEAGVPPPP